MLTRRLHVLIDEERHARLEAVAKGRGVPVAQIIRDAVDAYLPTIAENRAAVGQRILDADPMDVPPLEDLRAEVGDARRGRA